MKSRTSFFNVTVLKKDITRFAPAWALYLVFMLLGMLPLTSRGGNVPGKFMDSLHLLAAANLAYALVTSQLLFGDLFNTRLCNALHAQPLRRETWFATHTLSGILFSVVPNAVVALCFVPGLLDADPTTVGVIFVWMAAVTLEYLFFFGLAVFSVMCTGNRFAMLLVYGIFNFASMLAYAFDQVVYGPMLYGVNIPYDFFETFCPVGNMLQLDLVAVMAQDGGYRVTYYGEGWLTIATFAVIGIGLFAAALALYRRRKLECAGDFLAVQAVAPVFLIIYSLCVGAFCQVFFSLFSFGSSNLGMNIVLFVGMAVGAVTGEMLIRRTVKVFDKKLALFYGVLAGIVLASILLVSADPMGIVSYVPKTDEVSGVYVYKSYTFGNSNLLETDPEQIAQVTKIHQTILNENQRAHGPEEDDWSGIVRQVTLKYKLKNGMTVERNYQISSDCEAYALYMAYSNRPQVLFGVDNVEKILERKTEVRISDFGEAGEYYGVVVDGAYADELIRALWEDAQQGNIQDPYYHAGEGKEPAHMWYVTIDLTSGAFGGNEMKSVYAYENCVHTMAVIEKIIANQ